MSPRETAVLQGLRLVLALPLLCACVTAAPIHAQARGSTASEREGRPLSLSLLSGGAAFSAFRAQPVRAVLLDGGEERSFERLIAPETSTSLSIALSWWPAPGWGLRVAASWAPSSIGIRMEERDRAFLERGGEVGESGRFADLSVWSGEAALLLRLPTIASQVEPSLILGGGTVVYHVDREYGEPVPVGVQREMRERDRTGQPALVVGGSIRVPLAPGALGLTFELLDHVTLSPFDEREHAMVEREGLVLELDSRDGPDGRRRVINHLRFAAGVSFPLRLRR